MNNQQQTNYDLAVNDFTAEINRQKINSSEFDYSDTEIIFFPKDPLHKLFGVLKAIRYMLAIPDGVDWCGTFMKFSETRRQCQNRLLFRWHRIVGGTEHTIDYIHGRTKLEILQPMLLSWEKTHAKAAFDQQILDAIPDYETKIYVAYGIIRTSQGYLAVREFAEFLSVYQKTMALHGFVLTSKSDKDDKALGKYA